MKLSLEQPMI